MAPSRDVGDSASHPWELAREAYFAWRLKPTVGSLAGGLAMIATAVSMVVFPPPSRTDLGSINYVGLAVAAIGVTTASVILFTYAAEICEGTMSRASRLVTEAPWGPASAAAGILAAFGVACAALWWPLLAVVAIWGCTLLPAATHHRKVLVAVRVSLVDLRRHPVAILGVAVIVVVAALICALTCGLAAVVCAPVAAIAATERFRFTAAPPSPQHAQERSAATSERPDVNLGEDDYL